MSRRPEASLAIRGLLLALDIPRKRKKSSDIKSIQRVDVVHLMEVQRDRKRRDNSCWSPLLAAQKPAEPVAWVDL